MQAALTLYLDISWLEDTPFLFHDVLSLIVNPVPSKLMLNRPYNCFVFHYSKLPRYLTEVI